MSKTFGEFTLNIEEGEFSNSEIIALSGSKGSGKTTFLRLLAGLLASDEGDILGFSVSYKPQKFKNRYSGYVRNLLELKIGTMYYTDPQFVSDVVEPLNIEPLLDLRVTDLTLSDLQRVAIVLCLGRPADIYLIDELDHLDTEQRAIVVNVIKQFIQKFKKTAVVSGMPENLADRVIVLRPPCT